MLEEYVNDNYYARSTLAAINDAEKTKLRSNFEVKNLQSQWIAKYRLRALGQGACLKGISRAITMQGFTLMAITDAEKTKLRRNCDVKINKVNGP